MILGWQEQSNLENSLYDFIQDAIDTATLQVLDHNGVAIDVVVRVGYEFNDNWTLPCITLYEDSRTLDRSVIGSNIRLKNNLIIIDVRALNDRQRADLTDWLEDTINDGFPYYEYTPSIDPENPTRTLSGYVSIEWLFNQPVRLGDNADLVDRYRQNLSINAFIE